MKERERWRPEEDSLLHAYVKKYGAREWNLVSQRMNKDLDRDGKSCEERWKNYLKPGIKKGSLSEEEQRLVISLQAKYGNKWKKIAAQVPGRTAKRLGKWWEVYKEKQQKKDTEDTPMHSSNLVTEGNKYHHILETFAEKYMQNQNQYISPSPSITVAMPPPSLSLNFPTNTIPVPDFLNLPAPNPFSSMELLPDRSPWILTAKKSSVSSSYTSSEYSASPSCSSPSVTLSLSPSLNSHVAPAPKNTANEISETSARDKSSIHFDDSAPNRQAASDGVIMQQMSTLFEHYKDLEERHQSWLKHKKEASWRLKRLQDQLESEKARKRREKIEEIDSKVWALREEEKICLDRLEKDYRDQIARLHKDEEFKEARMMEMWTAQHVQLSNLFKQIVHRH
uniref:R2R3-MYB transcription factor 31 n=1 Tax=Taxus chinensis TaxID=29808 RepID=A0A6B9QQW8_TAXCH|nr:R2R3-MYB transcription factor 31 [Taxus chinensis]